MTDKQKLKIYKMRLEGLSYSQIALSLSISKNTIKSYCQKHGLGKSVKNHKKETITQCKYCNKPLIQNTKHKQRKFCSTKCKTKWFNQHRNVLRSQATKIFTCKNCNQSFVCYANSNRKYCCHNCYITSRFGKVEYESRNVS